MPDLARALSADWAPGPGVLVLFPPVARSLMWRAVTPSSCKFLAITLEKFASKEKVEHRTTKELKVEMSFLKLENRAFFCVGVYRSTYITK